MMKYIKTFESVNNETNLLIVDVQKEFKRFFTELYVHKLKEYCNQYKNVYQIWDNHKFNYKNVDKDYLYDHSPDIPVNNDLYNFPNQKDVIEKRYNYDVTVDFYKNLLDKETYKLLKSKENKLKKGDWFKTTEGTIIVFVGNRHRFFHVPLKLYKLFQSLKGKELVIVGGSDNECLEDIFVAGQSLGVKMRRDHRYIYSASHCSIK